MSWRGTLLGSQFSGLEERLAAHDLGVDVGESGVGDEPVRDREAGIGRAVRVLLAAGVLAGEAPAAQVVGAAEHRRCDPRPLLDLHDPTVTPW